jgi:hypothetical protein
LGQRNTFLLVLFKVPKKAEEILKGCCEKAKKREDGK